MSSNIPKPTNTPTHHPADDVLLNHVSGGLDTAFSLVVGTHIAMCDVCARKAAHYMEIGGAVLEAVSPAEMSASADAVLKAAQGQPSVSQGEVDASILDSKYPGPLRYFLRKPLEALKWSFLTPHLRRHDFNVAGTSRAGMLRMRAGQSVPAHGHNGAEYTLVLQGGYFDGDQAFTAGDMQIVDHETPHVPSAMTDGPCTVLYAKDAPLRFTQWLPRLLQPILKI